MTVRVAINGFGRIGRNILRSIIESNRKDIVVVGINDLGPQTTKQRERDIAKAGPLGAGFFVGFYFFSSSCFPIRSYSSIVRTSVHTVGALPYTAI